MCDEDPGLMLYLIPSSAEVCDVQRSDDAD
jgi:hypothetical protein